MIFRTPSYYKNFRCIADKCTDNCCIGWEIEVDSDTAEFYRSVQGDFGKRLKDNISDENCFMLKGERCPFLNDNNLCDIIINCGEDCLCQICRDHPRYFEWYGNIKEGGIGLSCEEGARLILTTDKVTYEQAEADEEDEEVDEELFALLLSAREKILGIIDDESKSFAQSAEEVLSFAHLLQYSVDNPHLTENEYCPYEDNYARTVGSFRQLLTRFGELEPIDESWTQEYTELMNCESYCLQDSSPTDSYCKNIMRYFIWRYFLKGVFDGEILSKVKFAVTSAVFIKVMTRGSENLNVWIEKSKLYSKQMEYSDENRERFYDISYEI